MIAASRTVDADRFRRALGRYLTGVTVVTTVDGQGRRWGMTANSFTSVSLDPPLVSVCIAKNAASYAAMHAAEFFGVSILGVFQEDVARRFASPSENKFEGVELIDAETRAPILADSTAWVLCSAHQKVDAGDHMLLIGCVESCDFSDEPPLGYCQGAFVSPTLDDDPAAWPAAGREIVAGWLVEQDGRVCLERTVEARWTLPSGPLADGPTMAEALESSGRATLGTDVQPSFLYSVIDLDDARTCQIYRAQLLGRVRESESLRAFAADDIPWESISHLWIEMILRRYLAERLTGHFGVYLNVVGRGRIAQLSDEGPWQPG